MSTTTLVIGCSHRSTPVGVRERISFSEESSARALGELHALYPDGEVVLLSTCNRLELYLSRPEGARPGPADIINFIGRFHHVPPAEFAPHLYTRENEEAVRHLFRVVCSLDSMVLGESQILAQAKHALNLARASGCVGKGLDPLFQRAFAVAKEVHTRTGIAQGRLSVGSTAVDLARQIFSHFNDKIIMMVGAGKMGELTLKHLLDTGPQRLWVTNRTDARAVALAEKIAAREKVPVEAVPFAQWVDHLAEVDIVITSAAAAEPLLSARKFAPVPARRRYRPLLLIDIAVPRNIEPEVAECEGVYLYNIDDLQQVVEATLAQRREALGACQQIIDGHVADFLERRARQDVGPLIAALQKRFRGVAESELQRILPKLESASAADRELIEHMLHRITQKLLHEPIARLNDTNANGSAVDCAQSLRMLFDLKAEDGE